MVQYSDSWIAVCKVQTCNLQDPKLASFQRDIGLVEVERKSIIQQQLQANTKYNSICTEIKQFCISIATSTTSIKTTVYNGLQINKM